MADASDKSVVVWWPNLRLGVPDAAEWSSLCLWCDQIVYVENLIDSTGDGMIRDGCDFDANDEVGGQTFRIKRAAFTNIIEQLRREGIIQDARFIDAVCEVFGTKDEDTARPSAYDQTVLSEPTRIDPLNRYEVKTPGIRDACRCVPKCLVERLVCFSPNDDVSGATDRVWAAGVSVYNKLPLATNDSMLGHMANPDTLAEQLSEVLATTAIAQLALPEIRPSHVDDLLEARTALRDELLEFRAGILNLTWLLHQQIKGENDLTEIRQEADMLVSTKIKAAMLSLEHRMRQHENKRIRRMLFGTGRVLVDAAKLLLPGGWQEKLITGGKALLQTATEINSSNPPEDQVATYLYKLKRQFKS